MSRVIDNRAEVTTSIKTKAEITIHLEELGRIISQGHRVRRDMVKMGSMVKGMVILITQAWMGHTKVRNMVILGHKTRCLVMLARGGLAKIMLACK